MSGRSTADPSLPILPDLVSIAKETHLMVRESSRIDAAPFFQPLSPRGRLGVNPTGLRWDCRGEPEDPSAARRSTTAFQRLILIEEFPFPSHRVPSRRRPGVVVGSELALRLSQPGELAGFQFALELRADFLGDAFAPPSGSTSPALFPDGLQSSLPELGKAPVP